MLRIKSESAFTGEAFLPGAVFRFGSAQTFHKGFTDLPDIEVGVQRSGENVGFIAVVDRFRADGEFCSEIGMQCDGQVMGVGDNPPPPLSIRKEESYGNLYQPGIFVLSQ